ncbi:adhesion G protein-coupled receptor D2 [Rhinophrynus dorsalis]
MRQGEKSYMRIQLMRFSCFRLKHHSFEHSHQKDTETAEAFFETPQGVYEYISEPLDRWSAMKFCEYKFASLLSEKVDSQWIPSKLLESNQVKFPIWLNNEQAAKPKMQQLTALVFENKTDTKHAKLLVHFPPMPEITVCAYIQWESTNKEIETIFSYAVPSFFNEFQLRGTTNEKGFVQFAIIVKGQHTPYSSMFYNDKQWHHVCVTWHKANGSWALYADGKRKAASTVPSTFQDIKEGGTFIIGQDQDSFGGTFKAKESFSGNITDLNIWIKVLGDNQIEQVRSCSVLTQNLMFGWKSQNLQKDPMLRRMNIQFACPDVYQRLRKTNMRNRAFSHKVNTIANRTVISENLLSGGFRQLEVSEAASSLQAIMQVMAIEGSSMDSADLVSVIQFLKVVANTELEGSVKVLEELSHQFVKVSVALLEQQDLDMWSEVNLIIKGPMMLVHTIEKMVSNLVPVLSDEKKQISVHHRSIEVRVRQIDLDADSYVYTVQSTEMMDNIRIPMEELREFKRGGWTDIKVVNMWLDVDSFQHLFGGYNNNVVPENSAVSDGGYNYVGTYLGSAIISSTLFITNHEVGTSVQYHLRHKSKISNASEKLNQRPICAFWNFSIRPENGGSWSTYGCSVKNNLPEETICFCNHSTNFAILMQVYEVQRSSEEEWTLRTLTFICCGVSLCALIVTFILFLAVGVPKSERTTVHKNLIFALAAAEALLMFSELAKTNEIVCITVTACLHLFFMAAFAWMLVEGLLLWSKVVAVNMSEDRRMRFYYITGWGLPIIIVSITLATSFNKYVADSHCWLNVQTDIIWAFVGPVLFILTVNTFVLFRVVMVTISSARRRSKMLTPNCSLEKQIGIQVWATAKPILVLLPVLGLTWLCGVLVHLSTVWAYVFIVLNSLQGLYIFMIYAIYNTEVRNAIQRMKEKKKALSFTNCSQPTNYVSSPKNTIWETGKPSLTPPTSSLSDPPLVKNINGTGNLVAKHPVNISSIFSTDKTDVELTAFKTSGMLL